MLSHLEILLNVLKDRHHTDLPRRCLASIEPYVSRMRVILGGNAAGGARSVHAHSWLVMENVTTREPAKVWHSNLTEPSTTSRKKHLVNRTSAKNDQFISVDSKKILGHQVTALIDQAKRMRSLADGLDQRTRRKAARRRQIVSPPQSPPTRTPKRVTLGLSPRQLFGKTAQQEKSASAGPSTEESNLEVRRAFPSFPFLILFLPFLQLVHSR